MKEGTKEIYSRAQRLWAYGPTARKRFWHELEDTKCVCEYGHGNCSHWIEGACSLELSAIEESDNTARRMEHLRKRSGKQW